MGKNNNRQTLARFFVSLVDGSILFLVLIRMDRLQSGIKAGDTIELVADKATDLADFFRSIWAIGPAGSDIEFSVREAPNALRSKLNLPTECHCEVPELH